MQEYPKALYLGTAKAHQHKIVNGAEHEAELRELGFVDFADLEQEADQPDEYIKDMRTGKAKTVPQDVYDQVYADRANLDAENQNLNAQLSIVRGERDRFKAENDDLKGHLHQAQEANKQLQQTLDSLQPNPAPQDTAVDTVAQGTPTEPVAPDYSKKTAKELRALLDEKGIKYLQRDDLDTLRALLTQSDKTEE